MNHTELEKPDDEVFRKARTVESWGDYKALIIMIYLARERVVPFRELEAFFSVYLLDERQLFRKVERLADENLIEVYSGKSFENGTTILRCLEDGVGVG